MKTKLLIPALAVILTNINRRGSRLLWLCFLLCFASAVCAQTANLWYSDFETTSDQDNWSPSSGTWEIGVPTSGPGSVHHGTNCAATVLGGNYAEGVDSRLERIAFVVPPATNNPRLRFWHWYSFSSFDIGVVQIKVGAGSWTDISPQYTGTSSGAWTSPSIDLSSYAGKNVQIGFRFISTACGGCGPSVSSGWYIDEITVVTGAVETLVADVPNGFELGLGDWSADRGTWEVGKPTSGPGSAFASTNCAATKLSGNYDEGVDSRLVSPVFIVPAVPDNPRLRFWHWFSFSSFDTGIVQIRAGTNAWQDISPQYDITSSGVWSSPSIDLGAYAGQSVQLGFRFTSTACGGCGASVSSGWYIDEVTIVTGAVQTLVANLPESFELSIKDWSAERGTWEVGVPTLGPATNSIGRRAFSGTNCAATVLTGNYAEGVDSRLVSPTFTVPPATENPRLRFWHWYSFSSFDVGTVQIKVGTNMWQDISPQYSITGSGAWTSPSIDLNPYAGQSVQICFRFTSTACGGCGASVSTGWYVDDITVVSGPIVLNTPDSFESGLGDWSAERGTWQVGHPTSGPGNAHDGTNCAATALAGNYDEGVDSRLISPAFIVPPAVSNPRLRFQHWFSFSSFDGGVVQIKVGTNGWQDVSTSYVNTSSGVWSSPSIPLGTYGGQIVRIGFHFTSTACGGCGASVSSGWYIDEVRLIHDPVLMLLDSPIVRTQTTACVSLGIAASTPPSAVNFTLQAPDGYLSSPSLNLTGCWIGNLTPLSSSQWAVSITNTCTTTPMGVATIGSICFNAISPQSAFVPLTISDLSGPPAPLYAFGSRAVLVADQPLLEGAMAGRQRMLTIFGIAGKSYEVDRTADLSPPITWAPAWTNTVPASLFYNFQITGTASNASTLFLRAKEQ
jgi:hypothetical protein